MIPVVASASTLCPPHIGIFKHYPMFRRALEYGILTEARISSFEILFFAYLGTALLGAYFFATALEPLLVDKLVRQNLAEAAAKLMYVMGGLSFFIAVVVIGVALIPASAQMNSHEEHLIIKSVPLAMLLFCVAGLSISVTLFGWSLLRKTSANARTD